MFYPKINLFNIVAKTKLIGSIWFDLILPIPGKMLSPKLKGRNSGENSLKIKNKKKIETFCTINSKLGEHFVL